MAEIKTQLSVHMENRPGALAELTRALVDAGVNLLGISLPDTGEFGTVRLLPVDVMEARAALQDGGYATAAVDVLAVELPHRPGRWPRWPGCLPTRTSRSATLTPPLSRDPRRRSA